MIMKGEFRPDLVLADYNLPNGMNGKQLILARRDAMGCPLPAIILTGDISSAALRDSALAFSLPLQTPVKLAELKGAIEGPLAGPEMTERCTAATGAAKAAGLSKMP